MSNDESPTILRRRMGAELRHLREAKGLTGEELATLMEWDRTKVYRIEGGKQKIRPKEVRELLGHLDVSDSGTVDQYVEMANQGKKRGWWSAYGPLPKLYDTYVGLEAHATQVRCWEPYVINGLLQTEAYARAITVRSGLDMSEVEVDRQVRVRLERQQRMKFIPLWVVLDESVLKRIVGGRDTMRRQLAHLVTVAQEPQVTLQVLPLDEGGHPAGRGAITIMTLEDGPVVYVDTPAGQIYPEGEHARTCSLAIEHLQARALSPNKSVQLIESTVERL